MKKQYTFSWILILLFIDSNLFSQPNFDTKNPTDWVELINGKSFDGWKASENESTWTFIDGMFQAEGKRSHLFYTGEHLKEGFKNFEIEVLVRTFKLANSGIYFHTEYQQSGWPSKGLEIQVNNTHIGEGDHIEYKKMASLYGHRNLYKAFGKDSVWMTVKARVESNHVQIWVNGLKTVDFVMPDNKLSKGTFALQGHDILSKMQYKSFKVRRLPDDVRSNLPVPTFGAWFDSMRVYQNRQFAFVDFNPHVELSPNELANYVYQTGINVALITNPSKAKLLKRADNLPLFTGIKVSAKDLNKLKMAKADYVIGESVDINTAKTLLASGKIHIWAHKDPALNMQDAEILLDLAKQNNVAIEIDNEMKTPSVEIIKLAKSKGCKFTFSGLIPISKMDNSIYIIEAIRNAEMNYKDLYIVFSL